MRGTVATLGVVWILMAPFHAPSATANPVEVPNEQPAKPDQQCVEISPCPDAATGAAPGAGDPCGSWCDQGLSRRTCQASANGMTCAASSGSPKNCGKRRVNGVIGPNGECTGGTVMGTCDRPWCETSTANASAG
ncbi:MAG: hypothetical protein KDA22_09535 [Phycisphaerales bacterium]|nr:hypothetical protein [Phycisphaerales bacterium]